MPFFKLGKTRVPHLKNTAATPPVRMPAPSEVVIPMSQHIGAPATPIVKAGDRVYVGTVIGEASGYVSVPVHSSVSGTVKKIDELLQSSGRKTQTVIIESDGLMEKDPAIKVPEINSLDELASAVKASGLVGLGGAGFPTHVKLDGAKKSKITKIVVNSAECEPYITSDTRTMLDRSDDIQRGIDMLLKFIDAEVIIGIESNKPECSQKMKEVFEGNGRVTVCDLPDAYPQGGEKILIYNTTGRVVPEGGLPSDVGVLIINVTSVAFIGKLTLDGMPLTEKCVTVDGGAIKEPKNVIVPIGTPIKDLIEFAGGFGTRPGKVLYGGPMMGIAICFITDPVLKNTNAVTALSVAQSRVPEGTACIHCGRCVNTCPMHLNPTAYAKAMNLDDHEERAKRLTAEKVNLCIECGSCSFVCPAKRPLVETNRLAKAELREYMSKQKKV